MSGTSAWVAPRRLNCRVDVRESTTACTCTGSKRLLVVNQYGISIALYISVIAGFSWKYAQYENSPNVRRVCLGRFGDWTILVGCRRYGAGVVPQA